MVIAEYDKRADVENLEQRCGLAGIMTNIICIAR